jgi:hypothetical protein
MADFPALDTLVLGAGGGYACGAIGELVDGPAEVTLRSPPPLGVPLSVGFPPDGAIDVHDGDTLIMSARPVGGVDVEPPLPLTARSVFLPDATVPNRGGVVAADLVWAALDHASATAAPPESVLARLAVERLDCIEVDEPMIATGWQLASDGREHHTAAALLSPEGDILARARALWISPRSPR